MAAFCALICQQFTTIDRELRAQARAARRAAATAVRQAPWNQHTDPGTQRVPADWLLGSYSTQHQRATEKPADDE